MAFPTKRQDHVFDSVKGIIHSDPYANEDDAPSATQMLKLRRKEESRQMYYKLLPKKEQGDRARNVLTNVFHQQLDAPTEASSRLAVPRSPQVLVTNLVGGKYYETRGEQIKDIEGPRGLGQRRDMISSLGPYSTTAAPRAQSSYSSNLFAADPQSPCGALRRPEGHQTANMQYGSHTQKFAEDKYKVAVETGKNESTALPRGETYDAETDCGHGARKPGPAPAPWQQGPNDGTRVKGPANPSASFLTVGDKPVSVPSASSAGMQRYGQGEQTFVAPSAAIGTNQPARLQRNALQQPSRLGYDVGNIGLRARATSASMIGTHSNNFAGRQPDAASDLVNCRTGASVHHRAVGVDEGAFRPNPKDIRHEGAHDKTVQRAGWMLSGRKQVPTATRATATETNAPIPTRDEMNTGHHTYQEHHQHDEPADQPHASEVAVYPPLETQQQNYHSSPGNYFGAKNGTSAPMSRVGASNPSYYNTNPAYWDKVRLEREQAGAKQPQVRTTEASSNPIEHWRQGSNVPRAASAAGGQRFRNRPIDTVARLF